MSASFVQDPEGPPSSRRHIDILLNVAASVLSLGSIQLLALPVLSRTLSPTDYGLMLLLTGIMNAVGVALGNPLNNTRLLLEGEYRKRGIVGDFAVLAGACGIAALGAVFVLAAAGSSSQPWYVWGSVAISGFLVFARAYYSVAFRILLNFRHIFLSSVAGFFGCLAGLGVNSVIDFWPVVFLAAELGQFLYVLRYSFVWREKLVRTGLFCSTSRRFGVLAAAGLISAAMPYLDRFVLFPVLGAHEVAVFIVASYLGKIVGGLAVPISGVLLAHDVRTPGGSRSLIGVRLVIVAAVCGVLYLVIIYVDMIVLGWLFPSLHGAAEPYLNVASAGALISVAGTLLNPLILRFTAARYQLLIQGVHLASFLFFGFIGIRLDGLYGFCWGVLLANVCRLGSMLLVGFWAFRAD